MVPGGGQGRLVAMVAAQAVGVAMLHRLDAGLTVDWADVRAWLAVVPAADAAVAALRYAGLVAGWWMLASTVVYLLARAAGARTAEAVAARLTLPAVRRVVDRAVAGGVLAALLLAGPVPAGADLVVPPAASRDGPAAGAEPGPGQGAAAPLVIPPPLVAPPAGAPTGEAPDRSGGLHVVAPGEHLWGIAAGVVAAEAGRAAEALAAGEVAPYWLAVVALNRDRLRSGNPDLIHPGESVVLPPLTRPPP